MRRIGIDVGGTNTDAVLLEDGHVMHAVKTPTTPDVTAGIVTALAELARHPEVSRGAIDGVVIGTTHFVNAVDRTARDIRMAGELRECGHDAGGNIRRGRGFDRVYDTSVFEQHGIGVGAADIDADPPHRYALLSKTERKSRS